MFPGFVCKNFESLSYGRRRDPGDLHNGMGKPLIESSSVSSRNSDMTIYPLVEKERLPSFGLPMGDLGYPHEVCSVYADGMPRNRHLTSVFHSQTSSLDVFPTISWPLESGCRFFQSSPNMRPASCTDTILPAVLSDLSLIPSTEVRKPQRCCSWHVHLLVDWMATLFYQYISQYLIEEL
jgi:hypothetical protein